MKVTVVPAQVTTIEDRIAGNLSMSQLMLLSIPIFLGSFLYMVLPPGLHGAAYKYAILTLLCVTCGVLAIRIKGTIVLLWLVVLSRYHVRPRRYSYSKRNTATKLTDPGVIEEEREEQAAERVPETIPERLSHLKRHEIESLLLSEKARLVLTTKKGGLYVRVSKAE